MKALLYETILGPSVVDTLIRPMMAPPSEASEAPPVDREAAVRAIEAIVALLAELDGPPTFSEPLSREQLQMCKERLKLILDLVSGEHALRMANVAYDLSPQLGARYERAALRAVGGALRHIEAVDRELVSAPSHASRSTRGGFPADHVECEGRRFQFRSPIEITVRYEDGIHSFESDELGVSGHDETAEGAWRAFCQDLAASWDYIVSEEDDRLTADAREFKQRLLAAVEKAA